MATPSNPKEGEELTNIAANLDATYGKGKWCEDEKKPESCLDINQIETVMRESRDEKKLRGDWRDIKGNFGPPGQGPRLRAGMALCIEPMITRGARHVAELADGWTVVSVDGSRAAHFEHTVAIIPGGPWVLTALEGERSLPADRAGVVPQGTCWNVSYVGLPGCSSHQSPHTNWWYG